MSGRFKLDENMPRAAERLVRESGHDVQTVLTERLGGTPDANVLSAARAEDRILITLDLDFADIRLYPPAECPGIWILRPQSQSIRHILSVLRGALELLKTEPSERRLWVVEPERVRVRE